jgi:CheY-like chemotaxis protein
MKSHYLIVSRDDALRRLISLNIQARDGVVDEAPPHAPLPALPGTLDALVLDLGDNEQEEHGWELARELRANELTRSLPFVLLGTCWPLPAQTLPLQPLVFVRKPFSVRTLLEALASARTASYTSFISRRDDP